MNRVGLITVFLIAVYDRAYSADISFPDAEVLGACISAIAPKAAAYSVGSKDKLVYVLPSVEATDGFASEGQLFMDLRGANWEALSAPFQELRNRISKGWVPPKDISAAEFQVEVAKPPNSEHLYFSFYPPGYSTDAQSSVVRALVGPTPHGASIACELSLQSGSWLVVHKWFVPYT